MRVCPLVPKLLDSFTHIMSMEVGLIEGGREGERERGCMGGREKRTRERGGM